MRFSQEINGIEQTLCRMWPVDGPLYITLSALTPTEQLGFGTWELVGQGRCLVGQDAGQTEFDTLGETGGVKEVTLTGTQSGVAAHAHAVTDPGHTHLTQRYPTATGGSSGFTIDTSMSGTLADNTLPTKSATTGITLGNTGSGEAHSNLPPYITRYAWERTA
jgi:microcystin-dependent protein